VKKISPYLVPFFFLASALALSPWKFDFPLNDDWAYAIPVRHLLHEGRIILSDWAAATQITQVLWSGIWAKLFGLNFGVLRLSTLVLGAGALFFFFLILREYGIDDKNASLAAACLAFNPLYFTLANSFMTDAQYLFWMIFSAYCYIKYERTGNKLWFWTASITACAAYLERQIGIFLPLSYTLSLYMKERRFNAKTALRVWGLPLLTAAVHIFWFNFIHGRTWVGETYVIHGTLRHITDPAVLLPDIFNRLISSGMETGFFIFPLAIGLLVHSGQFFRKKSPVKYKTASYISVFIFAAGCLYYLADKGPMPHLENNFTKTGLGAMTLPGSEMKACGIFGSDWFWNTATAAGIISFCVFLIALCAGVPQSPSKDKKVMHQQNPIKNPADIFLYACLMQFSFALLGEKFFDRYLLLLLPLQLTALARKAQAWEFSKTPVLVFLVLFSALSWTGVKDYFAWNEAKWKAGLSAVDSGITQEEVNGKLDWDGYWQYEKNMKLLKSIKSLKTIGEWEWRAMAMPKYKAEISFSAEGRQDKIISRAEYKTPFSDSPASVYLLKLF